MKAGEIPKPEAEQALAQVVEALHGTGFEAALSAWLRRVVPYSFTVIFGYRFEAKPLDIWDDFPSDRRRVFVSEYIEGPYLLDPFCQAAIRPVAEGLYRLRDFAPDRFYQGEYFRNYYMRTEIAEEIGFFAHMPDDCQIVLSLMRQEKTFSLGEFRRLAALAPLVCALMRQHWAGLSREFEARNVTAAPPRLDRLTGREREIVSYILKGHSAEATAAALGIASGTVRIHRRNIYAKLGISSQRELFARYLAGMGGNP